MPGITSDYTTIDGLRAYLARPAAGRASGGMLLLPLVTGIGAEVRGYADAIAATGVDALVWDPWHGRSSDDTPREELVEMMGRLDDAEVRAEQQRLLDHMVGEMGAAKAGVIGWCMGGRYALLLAGHDHRLANCVAYHPTVPAEPAPNHTEDAVALAAQITAPVKLVYPGADELVPHSVFLALRDALQNRPDAPSSVSLYPHADHGFMAPHRRDRDNNRLAAAVSWPETLAFIGATVA